MRPTRAHLGLILLSAVLGTAPAWGQSSTALSAADFTIKLQRPDGDAWVDLTNVDAQTYLNQARCLCDSRIRIVVQMISGSRSKLVRATSVSNARLYVGTNCATLSPFNQPICPAGELGQLNNLSTFSTIGSWAVETTVSRLFDGEHLGCAVTRTSTIWLWLDSMGAGLPDTSVSGASAPNLGIMLDGTPPPAPEGIVVEGADKSLQVSWSDESADHPDLVGYLVFCMRGEGLQVFDSSPYNGQYQTGLTMCGAGAPLPSGPDPMVSAAGGTTAIELDAPQPFQDLDPRFLCSGLLSPADTKHRVRSLQDGIPYTVGIAAVDLSGNASPIRKAFVQSPVAGVDPLPDPDAGATDAGITKHGSSGCECHLAGTRRDEIPWLALLGLALLRRRGRSNSGC